MPEKWALQDCQVCLSMASFVTSINNIKDLLDQWVSPAKTGTKEFVQHIVPWMEAYSLLNRPIGSSKIKKINPTYFTDYLPLNLNIINVQIFIHLKNLFNKTHGRNAINLRMDWLNKNQIKKINDVPSLLPHRPRPSMRNFHHPQRIFVLLFQCQLLSHSRPSHLSPVPLL